MTDFRMSDLGDFPPPGQTGPSPTNGGLPVALSDELTRLECEYERAMEIFFTDLDLDTGVSATPVPDFYDSHIRQLASTKEGSDMLALRFIDQANPLNSRFVDLLFASDPSVTPSLTARKPIDTPLVDFLATNIEYSFGFSVTPDSLEQASRCTLPRAMEVPPRYDARWENFNPMYYLWYTIRVASGVQPTLYHILRLAMAYSEHGGNIDSANEALLAPSAGTTMMSTPTRDEIRADDNDINRILMAINQYAQFNTNIMLQNEERDSHSEELQEHLLIVDRILAELSSSLQNEGANRTQMLADLFSYISTECNNQMELRSQHEMNRLESLMQEQQAQFIELARGFTRETELQTQMIERTAELINSALHRIEDAMRVQPVIQVAAPAVHNEISPVINVAPAEVNNTVQPIINIPPTQVQVTVPQQQAPVISITPPEIRNEVTVTPQQVHNVIHNEFQPVIRAVIEQPGVTQSRTFKLKEATRKLIEESRANSDWKVPVNNYIRAIREIDRCDTTIDFNTPIDMILTSSSTPFILPADVYACPWCGMSLRTHTSLTKHVSRIHGTSLTNNLSVCLRYAKAILHPDTHVTVCSNNRLFDTEEIFQCPSPVCTYVTNKKTNLGNHCKRAHPLIAKTWKSVNEFWRMVVAYAQQHGKVPSFSELLCSRSGFICREEGCTAIMHTTHSVNTHYTEFHQHETTETVHTCRYEKASFCISTTYRRNEREVEDDVAEQQTTENDSIQTERNEGNGVSNGESQQETTPVEDTTVTAEEVQDTRTEEAVEVRAPQVPQAPPAEPISEHTNEHTNERTREPIREQEEALFSPQSREETNRGLEWREDLLELEFDKGCPYMTPKVRRKIKEGLGAVLDQCIDIMRKYGAAEKISEERWQAFEGAMLKCNDLIREHIANKLELVTRRSNRRRAKRLTKDMVANKCRLIKRLILYLAEIADLKRSENTTSAMRNRMNSLTEKATTVLEKLKDPKLKNIDVGAFLSQDVERNEESLKWLKEHLGLVGKEAPTTTPSMGLALREAFHDNPRKTIERGIFKKTSPRCKIPPASLQEFFTKAWADEGSFREFEEDSPFFCEKVINSNEDDDVISNTVLNKEAIKSVLRTRNHGSASGHDGVPYSVFKLEAEKGSTYLQLVYTTIVKNHRVPVSWKRASTVLIYKKGNENEPCNWRPISILNAQYRIFTCLLNNAFMSLNEELGVLHESQKGFTRGINGCLQNSVLLSEIIQHSRRTKKNLYLTFLDLENAFGSTPFKLIWSILAQKGFSNNTIDLIKSIYKGNTTTIKTNGDITDEIAIQKGVRQGCPLSPFLFNLCIDPILRDISFNLREKGYKVGQHWVAARGYADDVVLISESRDGMESLLKEFVTYCKRVNIKVRPEKSSTLSTVYRNGRFLQDTCGFEIDGTPITEAGLGEGTEYLGVPVGRSKTKKILSERAQLERLEFEIREILDSSLAITQKIFALNTFIFPQIDYTLLLGSVNAADMERLDSIIRSKLNDEIGTLTKIPIPAFYAAWKDGGMNITSLATRKETLALVAFNHWINSGDTSIPRYLYEEELQRRGITQDVENGRLLEAWTFTERALNQSRNSHGATIASSAARAANNLKLKYYNNWQGTITMKLDEEDEVVEVSLGKTMGVTLKRMLEKRALRELLKMKGNGHSFYSLSNNPLSNTVMKPSKDGSRNQEYKYTIGLRTNTLPTRETRAIINNEDTPKCTDCNNNKDTLAHILNGCITKRTYYGYRHDEVQKIVVGALLDRGIERINEDMGIDLEYQDRRLRNLRPDITYFDREGTFHIVEITVPYGNIDEQGHSSLTNAREKKIEKYRTLVTETKHLMDTSTNVKFHVLVVSSLGAVHPETTKAMNEILMATSPQEKRRVEGVLRRISSKATYCSWLILGNTCPRRNGER